MGVIFYLSSQSAEVSSETSGSLIEALLKFFYPGFDGLSAFRKEELISSLQFAARKSAHCSIYGVLGVFSFLTFVSYRRIAYSARIFISLAVCLIWAVSDEIHQLFVPGRSCEARDVLIDFCGSLLAVFVMALFSRCVKSIYKRIKTVTSDGSDCHKNTGGCGMSKKELFEQNIQLFDKLTAAEERISALEKQLAERDNEIIALKNERERLESKLNATPPLKALEAKVEKQASVSPEIEYGAAVIGKIVVEAAKYINRVTSRGEQEYTKELINLILGRTEVAKSEILGIVSSDVAADEKKRGADAQLEQAKDYFESIIAQVQ